MITEELTELLRISDTMSGYQKNKMVQICKRLAAKYNSEVSRRETILKNEYNITGRFDDWIEKLVNVSELHGYDNDNLFEINDKFIIWMRNNKTLKYKGDKINRELLSAMSTEWCMFQLDFERLPNDYQEFRNYLTREDDEQD